MKNSALEVDPKRYGRLLARKLPAVIRTEEENERLIAELEQLDKRYDELTPEEREYSELLTVLIEAFEDANYVLEGSTPDSRLRGLMEEHGLRQRDLLDVFGSRGIASEVVSGKRAISKAQAKKLAQLFHVPADPSFERTRTRCWEARRFLRHPGDLTVGAALLERWLPTLDTFRTFAA